jgi:CDP-diacylglycerol--glycerol-3-phosphate 3-phosphatidyltransferase
MERLAILAPAAFGVVFVLAMLVVYTVLAKTQRLGDLGPYKPNFVLGPFWAGFIVWLLRPVERVLLFARIAPIHITASSLVLCIAAGVAVAFGHLASGAWLYILGGMLDLLDGRLARALDRHSRSGALFDSVADRWGELAVFTGFAWYLRGADGWLLAVMAATAGSVMVSYTRARAESLGLELSSGAMQRAERIALVSVGTLVAAWLDAGELTASLAPAVVGLSLAACGGFSIVTAVRRWTIAHRALATTERRIEAEHEVTLAAPRSTEA